MSLLYVDLISCRISLIYSQNIVIEPALLAPENRALFIIRSSSTTLLDKFKYAYETIVSRSRIYPVLVFIVGAAFVGIVVPTRLYTDCV